MRPGEVLPQIVSGRKIIAIDGVYPPAPEPAPQEDMQKLDAICALAGIIAHDYNNLLTGILGNLELLENRARKSATDLGSYIDGARSAADRAVALNSKLLAVSGNRSLNKTPVLINTVLTDITPQIRAVAGPGIAFNIATQDECWPILCDADCLREAILELAANAKDAMPEGGTLNITTGNAAAGSGRHGMPTGDYVMLSVQDSGLGMHPDIIARAFEPFFSTRQRGAGSGLGLAIVRGFIRQCGGHAVITTSPAGTTVALCFPKNK